MAKVYELKRLSAEEAQALFKPASRLEALLQWRLDGVFVRDAEIRTEVEEIRRLWAAIPDRPVGEGE